MVEMKLSIEIFLPQKITPFPFVISEPQWKKPRLMQFRPPQSTPIMPQKPFQNPNSTTWSPTQHPTKQKIK